ncbi:MAG: DUF2344 domain-containing protein [Nitrospirae bacterium]|nr:DUF2344 domain-containing protein [Nitrospirota bacterium]
MNLSCFQRPSRYINNELNSIKKDASLRVCLSFPDIYEIGMSHLGLKILYKIINDLPYASAERAFHPWLDMEAHMRQKKIPLCSLESKTPIREFDIIGFSLQYELSYPAVLNMLSLGGIPLKAEERQDSSPLIIAGGPCTTNPLPMSPFIDAFFIGDAEEAIKEIAETVLRWKNHGDKGKHSLIKKLAEIEGIYVPSESSYAKRRIIGYLNDAPYPTSPVVPYAQIVHDRINIEVSRGCSMGCRFCQAGMIYRPVRERTPKKAIALVENSLASTGYEEVSFTSLSAGDYTSLIPLLKEFNRRFSMDKVSVSLPSLRVKAVNADILKEIKSVRKTGFTIAPEAGTERLRCVINKDFGEEDYERALVSLFKAGWHNLKLYFMIGLPTETHEDIEAIPKMVFKALKTAKTYTSRYVNINVSVSPFVPKPHTPFQWCAMEDISEIKAKKAYLKKALKGINLKGHDEHMSLLEAVIAKGDKRLSGLIETAFMEGVKLPAWSEAFDFGLWLRAMDKTGIDVFQYAKKDFGIDEPLPWDIIDTGINKEFLKKEFRLAHSCQKTEGCRVSCAVCGLNCKAKDPNSVSTEDSNLVAQTPSIQTHLLRKPVRLRVEFSKTGALRYLSHRELITLMSRALRKAGVRLRYSEGFHPVPRLSFCPPLNVGVSGLKEYFDMEVLSPYNLDELIGMVNSELKDGVKIKRIHPVSLNEPSLQSFISRYEYEIIGGAENFDKRRQEQNTDGTVEALNVMNEKVNLILKDTAHKKVRLDDVLRELFGAPLCEFDITRLCLYGLSTDGRWMAPIR